MTTTPADPTPTTPTARTALITGGNRSIGLEAARMLGRQMTVLIGSRDAGRGQAAADELRAEGIDAHPVQLEVTDSASIAAAADWIAGRYGSLDVLVNNAAIASGEATASSETGEAMREVFDINVFGLVAVTNAMLPLLRKGSAARIVNVSSEVGSITRMSDQQHPLWSMQFLAYPVSKAAVNMITAQYAKELRDSGILVNAANPGYCATDLGRQDRGGSNDLQARREREPWIRSAEQGAEVLVHLATLPDDGPSGILWGDDSFALAGQSEAPYAALPW